MHARSVRRGPRGAEVGRVLLTAAWWQLGFLPDRRKAVLVASNPQLSEMTQCLGSTDMWIGASYAFDLQDDRPV
jgi:hypothetical protein